MESKSIIKQNLDLIFAVSFPYATILTFTAFGPTLRHLMNTNLVNLTSTIFLILLVISMLIKPGFLIKAETGKKYIPALIIITFVGLVPFAYYPTWLQICAVSFLAILEGRIASTWSRYFLKQVKYSDRGKVVGIILFISYGFLYLANLVFPSLPSSWLPIITSLPLLISIPFFIKIQNNKIDLFEWKKEIKRFPPVGLLILFLIIYISAGVTYSGIFPHLVKVNKYYRFWNVLPFILTVPFIGKLADKHNRNLLILLGITSLGLSYIIYLFPVSNIRNFIIEIPLQTGWAFLDAAVWIIGADMAEKYQKSQYQLYAVASFLTGTFLGSILYMILSKYLDDLLFIFIFITYIPLFLGVFLTGILIEKKQFPKINTYAHIETSYSNLTPREKEISKLLYKGDSNKEISYLLNISHNTLKTHIRNIYKKTGISKRSEFRQKMNAIFNPPKEE